MYSVRKDIDILLIPPAINPVLFTDFTNFIPVGLLALLSSLSEAGYTAEIYKPCKTLISKKDYRFVAEEIVSYKCRTVGFSTWCHSFPEAILVVTELKKIVPDLPTIFGGPHISAIDADAMDKFKEIDYILRGEADQSLPKLLSFILDGSKRNEMNNIPGLTYRDKYNYSRIIRTSEPPFIEKLDTLPVPAYEKITDINSLRLDVGRGCPFHCIFCSTNQFFSKKYRLKSVERILMEMNICQHSLNIDHMGFSHDNLTVNEKFTEKLSARIKKANSEKKDPIYWTCSTRIDCITEEMITAMYEGGCRALFFGIESGSPDIQKQIKKNLDLGNIFNKIEQAIQLGMKVTVSYIIGFPDESEEDVEMTLKSVLQMASMGAEPQMTLLSVLPGTPLFLKYVSHLKYDGKTFGMAGSFLTQPVIKLVKSNRKLFSSFHYIPCKYLNREDLVFISNIVNLLFLFLPTMRVLREFLIRDVTDFSLFRFIVRKKSLYQNDPSVRFPELFCLSDVIRKYLQYLTSKGLQEYMLDIFKADLTRAYMQVKYNNWQYLRAGNELPVNPKKILVHYYIKVRPIWEMISVNFNILQYVNNPVMDFCKNPIQKGNFHYVVLPVSENQTRLFKVSDKYMCLIKNLKDMPVYEFLNKYQCFLERNKLISLLRKLMNLGMIEIRLKS